MCIKLIPTYCKIIYNGKSSSSIQKPNKILFLQETLQFVIRSHALKILRYIVRSLRSSTQVINLSLACTGCVFPPENRFRLFYTIKRYSLEKKNYATFPPLYIFVKLKKKIPFDLSFTHSIFLVCGIKL